MKLLSEGKSHLAVQGGLKVDEDDYPKTKWNRELSTAQSVT